MQYFEAKLLLLLAVSCPQAKLDGCCHGNRKQHITEMIYQVEIMLL